VCVGIRPGGSGEVEEDEDDDGNTDDTIVLFGSSIGFVWEEDESSD
jgi:hypothetical protein